MTKRGSVRHSSLPFPSAPRPGNNIRRTLSTAGTVGGTDMGIHDGDYYRDDGDSYLGNWSRYGQVTKSLIVITVIAFVIQLGTLPRGSGESVYGPFTNSLDLVGSKVLQGQVWRLVTCGFLHDPDGIFHILFNMIILWLVGRELEERHGAAEFLAFYFLALGVSSLA